MSDYLKPITKLAEINDDECVAGYLAGMGFTAVNNMQKSRSYWHGYRNGQVDRGLEPISPEQMVIASEFSAAARATGAH